MRIPKVRPFNLEKAERLGFRTDMPLFHGTGGDISAFDLSKGGSVGGSPVGKLGVSLATDPETASEFALAAGRAEGAAPNVMPVFHRAERPAVLELDGKETNFEIFGAVQDAWAAGFDSIMFKNYTTPGGQAGKSFVLVKDPSQIRSSNAKFDPSRVGESDLLGSATPEMLGFTLNNAYRAARGAERNTSDTNPLLQLLGGMEAVATVGSSTVAERLSGLAGLLALADSPEAAAAVVQGVQDRLTYTPRTRAGQSSINALAELLQPISRPMNALAELLASGGAEAARSAPFIGENQNFQNAAAALGYALPAGLAELIPGGAVTRSARRLSRH